MSIVLVLIIVVGGIAFVALATTRLPRRRSALDEGGAPGTERGEAEIPPYPGTDRPGGPGAEAMGSDQPGESTPAPADARPTAAGDEAVPPSEGSTRGTPGEPGTDR